jgi:hypothetical protein
MRTTTRRPKSSAQIPLFNLHAATNPEFSRASVADLERNPSENSPAASIHSKFSPIVQVSVVVGRYVDPDLRSIDLALCREGIAIIVNEMCKTGMDGTLTDVVREFHRLDADIEMFLRADSPDEARAEFEHEIDARWRSLRGVYQHLAGASVSRLPLPLRT